MKISKEYKDDYGGRLIKIDDREYHIDGDILSVNFDVREMGESFTFEDEERIASNATIIWENHLAIKKDAKKTAIQKKTVAHWYNELDDAKRHQLCQMLPEKIERVVDRYIASNPNSKLNSYYLTIPERCKSRPPAFPKVNNKKLVGLPEYMHSIMELVGSDLSFIRLAALIYPPRGRLKTGNRSMSEL